MNADLARASKALFTIPADLPREEWVKAGMAAQAAGLTFDDFDQWSAQAGNYDARAARETWRSFKPGKGIGPGTLFSMAADHGYRAPKTPQDQCKAESRPVTPPSAVSAVWGRFKPATGHSYIEAKQGLSDGLRVVPDGDPLTIAGHSVAGWLVVPAYAAGELQSLQFIPPPGQGKKLNMPRASMAGASFTVGTLAPGGLVYVAEGIGQAWACWKATGRPAIVAFGWGNVARVAGDLRGYRVVIVPDRGKEEQAATIAADVAGQWVAMPTDKPGNYDANDYAAEHGSEALAALLDRPQAPLMRFKVLSGADLCNAPPMRWMVRGVLPVEGLAALFGASGSGKSFLMLDIAGAVAGGDYEWFGRRVTQCPVTYVCLEGEAGMGKRVKAWSLHHKQPVPDALRFITQPFDLLSDDVPELAKAVIAGGGAGGLVILDTLNRAAPGADENSSVDMGQIIAAAKRLQSLTGGLVLLVHHTGKDATKGLRGHSSLYAALDGAIEVIATDSRRAWSVAKSKDDVTGDAHPFKLEIVPIGTDDEGDEITSCVIVPDESAEAIKQAKRPTLRSNQKIANEALGEALRKSQHFGKEGAPAGRPCIQYADAVALVAERIPADAKHKTSRAKVAITGLVERGFLALKGDWLWDK